MLSLREKRKHFSRKFFLPFLVSHWDGNLPPTPLPGERYAHCESPNPVRYWGGYEKLLLLWNAISMFLLLWDLHFWATCYTLKDQYLVERNSYLWQIETRTFGIPEMWGTCALTYFGLGLYPKTVLVLLAYVPPEFEPVELQIGISSMCTMYIWPENCNRSVRGTPAFVERPEKRCSNRDPVNQKRSMKDPLYYKRSMKDPAAVDQRPEKRS